MYTAPLILVVIFGFVVILVLIDHTSKIVRERIKAKSDTSRDGNFIDYDRRLEKLEERIANLETIVLEQERYKKFSNL